MFSSIFSIKPASNFLSSLNFPFFEITLGFLQITKCLCCRIYPVDIVFKLLTTGATSFTGTCISKDFLLTFFSSKTLSYNFSLYRFFLFIILFICIIGIFRLWCLFCSIFVNFCTSFLEYF